MTVSSRTRYGVISQTLHWITAILVLIAFTFGPGGPESRVYSAAHDFDRNLHETLGLIVFGLFALRLLWRLVDKRPEPVDGARWMELTAKAVQVALYLLLLAVPLTAVAGAWFGGHPLTLLGGAEYPPAVGKSEGFADFMVGTHKFLGDVILWLAGLHAVAALFHHFVLKDRVLVSMLPRWFPGAGVERD